MEKGRNLTTKRTVLVPTSITPISGPGFLVKADIMSEKLKHQLLDYCKINIIFIIITVY